MGARDYLAYMFLIQTINVSNNCKADIEITGTCNDYVKLSQSSVHHARGHSLLCHSHGVGVSRTAAQAA
jgi:hypothetical protein